MSKERDPQLDYLKGIFILLMVSFHLALVEHTYPTLREAVYTFHMSAFLVISGYLANVHKRPAAFGQSMMRLLVPYCIFEAVYIIMQHALGSSLGAHNAIDQLSTADFIVRIATMPTGPYWYIHTLLICTVVYWLIFKVLAMRGAGAMALMGLILYGLSCVIEGLSWSNVIYFLIGAFIRDVGLAFSSMIKPSLWTVLPLAVLFVFPENFVSGSLPGVIITVLVISLLQAVYPHVGASARHCLCYLGRNSLAIVIFSPIFTIATKPAVPLFSFDPTAVCFWITALVFIVACCLLCAHVSDKLSLSRFLFLKRDFYTPFKQV